jgi:hypothetical protein
MHAPNLSPYRPSARANEKFVAHLAFLLLFPGFFFYQTLLGLGIIGAFLGGYFTLVALILTPPLVYFYFKAVKRHQNYCSESDLVYVLFIIYYILVLAINFAGGANSMIVQRYVQGMIFCVDTYIMFRMMDFDDRKFVLLAVASLILMSIITIYFSVDGFFYLQALNEAKDPDSLATYQGFARSYIYTFLIVISLAKFIGARFLLYGLATATLFLNGARSEFSAVLFLIPIIEFYYLRHKLHFIIPFFFLMVLFGTNAGSIAGMLPDNRTLQLLDLSRSSSAVARQHLTQEAWRTITANPVFGEFASYTDGHYSHNILGAWVDFGLVGFVFFAALLIRPAIHLFTGGFFLKTKSTDFILTCSFICITILWALTAKNVPDMSVGAAMGAYAKYRYRIRYGVDRPAGCTSSHQHRV